jgi:hypothetical protein
MSPDSLVLPWLLVQGNYHLSAGVTGLCFLREGYWCHCESSGRGYGVRYDATDAFSLAKIRKSFLAYERPDYDRF